MDQRDPYRLDSISLDNDYDNGQQNLWDEDEEIELGSDENELFLRHEYVKPASNDILPFKVSATNHTIMASQHNQRNGFTKHSSKFKNGQSSAEQGSTKIETFQVDDSGHGSPAPSSVVYQMPNYNQFAGSLAPTSPNSVIVSFIIIFVILSVTIVPKVIPKSQTPYAYDDDDDDVIESSSIITDAGSAQEYSHQSVHSDARCKCICPPLLSSTVVVSSAGGNNTANSTASKPNKNNSTTIANSKTANQRRLYVGKTLPDHCNCNNIVRAHFQQDTKVSFKEFCARCECRYQSRNTTTIRRNVVFFIAVLVGLAFYLLIQYLLKHFRITRRGLPPHLRWLSHQTATESN